jgi:hypothetical protein
MSSSNSSQTNLQLTKLFLKERFHYECVPVNVVKLGASPTVDNPTYAVPYSQLTNMTILIASSKSNTQDGFFSFMKANGTTPANSVYQVPSGKKFLIVAAYMLAGTSGAGAAIGWGTATVADNSTTPPSGYVTLGGGASTTNAWTVSAGATAHTLTPNPQVIGMTIPANQYVTSRYTSVGGGAHMIILHGYEV